MSEQPTAADGRSGAGDEQPAPQAAPEQDPRPDGNAEGPSPTGAGQAHDASEEAREAVEHDLDELSATQRQRDEYLELAQRTKADFDNYRRRVARETQEALARGRAELARDLVPVIDNLERAVGAAGIDPDEPSPEGPDAPSEEVSARDALARGVALVLRELRETLARAGVEAYDPAGETFDPAWHEALSTRPHEGTAPGIVVETLERGYRLDGQVLRPARVIVSE